MELDNTIQPIRETKEEVPPEPVITEIPTITITISPAKTARIVVIGGAD